MFAQIINLEEIMIMACDVPMFGKCILYLLKMHQQQCMQWCSNVWKMYFVPFKNVPTAMHAFKISNFVVLLLIHNQLPVNAVNPDET